MYGKAQKNNSGSAHLLPIILLTGFMGLFVWAVVFGNFNFRSGAATSEESCQKNKPTITLSPPDITATAGSTHGVVVTIQNKDTGNCLPLVSTISVEAPVNWPSATPPPPVYTTSGTSTQWQHTVSIPSGTSGGSYNMTFTTNDSARPGDSVSMTLPISVQTIATPTPTPTTTPTPTPVACVKTYNISSNHTPEKVYKAKSFITTPFMAPTLGSGMKIAGFKMLLNDNSDDYKFRVIANYPGGRRSIHAYIPAACNLRRDGWYDLCTSQVSGGYHQFTTGLASNINDNPQSISFEVDSFDKTDQKVIFGNPEWIVETRSANSCLPPISTINFPAEKLNNNPVITTVSLSSGQINKKYNATIVALDTDTNDQAQLAITGLPSGINVGRCSSSGKQTTCIITGTPNRTASADIKIVATDKFGGSSEKTLKLNIVRNLNPSTFWEQLRNTFKF